MIVYPLSFGTKASAAFGIARTWEVESSGSKAACAIPPEFEGPGGAYSPEDFFAQAMTNCFVATFKVMAEKSDVSFENVSVAGELIVDRNELKRPVMKSFHFKILLRSPSNPARAEQLVKKAVTDGFILNSVKTHITYELEII